MSDQMDDFTEYCTLESMTGGFPIKIVLTQIDGHVRIDMSAENRPAENWRLEVHEPGEIESFVDGMRTILDSIERRQLGHRRR